MEYIKKIPEVPVIVFILIAIVILLYCIALAMHTIYKRTGNQEVETWSLHIEKCADSLGVVTAMYIIVAFISLVLTKIII